MKIVEGPNLNGWLVIGFVLMLSIVKLSFLPILYFLAVVALLTPACFLLHRLDRRAGLRMLEEFPHDPYIQKKYAKYRT
jgi:hypothetical protein